MQSKAKFCRAAAARQNLALDCIGYYVGPTIPDPENVLPGYDIVFASGLSAIEALASGCALIVLGRESCGEMVRPENFDRFRETNFSIATNSPPPSAERIEAEIESYSVDRCASVTERFRREGDFMNSVRRLLDIYADVIERHRRSKSDKRAEILAAGRYLRRLTPIIRKTDETVEKNDWSYRAA